MAGSVGRPSRMSGSGREALPNVRKWSRGLPGSPRLVEMPSWMSGSGREVVGSGPPRCPVVPERSGGPSGCLGVVGRPYRMSESHFRMTGSGQLALLDVETVFRMSESGLDALPEVREWSGDPPECPGVIGRPSRMSGSPCRMFGRGRLALSDVREWSEGLPGCPGGVAGSPGVVKRVSGCPGVFVRPSRLSRSGRQTLPYVREPLPDDR